MAHMEAGIAEFTGIMVSKGVPSQAADGGKEGVITVRSEVTILEMEHEIRKYKRDFLVCEIVVMCGEHKKQ